MNKYLAAGVGALILLAVVWIGIGPDWRRFVLNPPGSVQVLEWTVAQRDAGFRMMDRVPFLVEARVVKAAQTPRPLAEGSPLDLDFDLDAYLAENRSAALLVLHEGKIRLERYGLDFAGDGRWTSFSVAKSFTSTLTGAAIKDGYIKSLGDKVSDYIGGLKGSAYENVSVEQLLTMSSGVAWNEDYEDPQSDVSLFNTHVSEDGLPSLVSYMRALPRAHAPGTVWHYSTGETNLIGILVSAATGKTLADYLSEKIWEPYGMEQDATWLLNRDRGEISGCCIQAAPRDFARLGQFILEGAEIDGESIVPDWWLNQATTKRMDYGVEGEGYGYQWWTYDTGSFWARGIFGQSIYIDPQRELVIVSNSNWRSARGQRDGEAKQRDRLHQIIMQAIDAEAVERSFAKSARPLVASD